MSDQLNTNSIFNHLEELYAIAQKHNNSRSVTNGYMASAEYVQAQLQHKAGSYCDVSTQKFKVPVWSELAAPELSSIGIGHDGAHIQYQNKVDFQSKPKMNWVMLILRDPAAIASEASLSTASHPSALESNPTLSP